MRLLLFVFLPCTLFAQEDSFSNEQIIHRLKSDVYTLASDDMEGREPGTPGEIKARDFIAERMSNIGLEPMGTDEFTQAFSFRDVRSVDQKEITAHNVIGFIDNQSANTVVISAHYDHLGYGDHSLNKTPEHIHNGADDNASGTAALLELAYYFNTNEIVEKNNFLFIAFSGEEKGLLGSKYFVTYPTIDLNEVNYVLNMDMIGRMEPNMELTIEGTGSSLIWESSLKEVDKNSFPLKLKKRESGPSDHAALYKAKIPVLHFWTGKHSDYHKPSDDAEKINFEAESQIISFIESFILLMDEKKKVEFYLRQQ